MKCVIIICLAIYMVFAANKMHLAVIDLEPQGGVSQSESQILTSKLSTELVKESSITVVERNEMKTILQEQGFQQTGCTSSECAVEIGELLGVSHIIAGTIGKVDDNYYIALKRISVESGKIERTCDRMVSGSLSNTLIETIPLLATEIVSISSQSKENRSSRIETTTAWTFLDLFIYPQRNLYGLGVNFFNTRSSAVGIDIAAIFTQKEYSMGLSVGALYSNIEEARGITVGGLYNRCSEMHLLQIGAINYADRVEGVQIGALNIAETLKGVQLGGVLIKNRSKKENRTIPTFPIFLGIRIGF